MNIVTRMKNQTTHVVDEITEKSQRKNMFGENYLSRYKKFRKKLSQKNDLKQKTNCKPLIFCN